MAELVELGEKIGGDLQRVEVKEEVKNVENFVGVVAGGGSGGGGAAGPEELQAGIEGG